MKRRYNTQIFLLVVRTLEAQEHIGLDGKTHHMWCHRFFEITFSVDELTYA